jgi:methylglutaconyl-CoA hydratase
METLNVSHTGRVATVTLDRPDVRNAFNDQVVVELTLVFREMDESVQVVVLQGVGKSFCAGADLNWMKKSATYTQEQNADDARAMLGLFDAINSFAGVVIGRVHGAALGGGVGLVACCDIVVATERAKFGLTEVRLGIVPAVISPFVVAKIGVNHARRYFVTGEIFDAQTAYRIGLVSEVVADDEALDLKINELTHAVTGNGPIAVKESKKLITEVTTLPREDALEYAVQTIARLRVSKEGQEGLSAFLEKRKPGWQ